MELEDHIFFLCTQVVYRRDSAIQAALRPVGMLQTEWRVLGTLRSKGALTMLELVNWTAYERTRLTRMLDNMEARGWVARGASDSDGRATVVSIVRKGRSVHARAEQIVEALTASILQGASATEVDQVRGTLQSIRHRLIELGN